MTIFQKGLFDIEASGDLCHLVNMRHYIDRSQEFENDQLQRLVEPVIYHMHIKYINGC
jgi:hypothetical protein